MVEPVPKFQRLSVQQVRDVTVVRPVDTELTGHVVTQELGEELIRLVEQDKATRILFDLSSVRTLSSSMLNRIAEVEQRRLVTRGQAGAEQPVAGDSTNHDDHVSWRLVSH